MSNFPGSVDAFATKVDHVTPVLADDVNKLQDAVVAIESELKTPTAGLGYAVDAAVLHLAGAEAATGNKTFLGSIIEGKDFRRSAQSISETVLVSGVDATAGELVDVTLTANRVVGLPLNPAVGQELVLLVTMGGTGGYKLTYPAGIKTAWQPASAVGDISALRLRYFGTNWQQIGGQVAVSQLGVLAHRGPAVVGSLTVRDPNLSGPYTQLADPAGIIAGNDGASAYYPGTGTPPTYSIPIRFQHTFGAAGTNVKGTTQAFAGWAKYYKPTDDDSAEAASWGIILNDSGFGTFVQTRPAVGFEADALAQGVTVSNKLISIVAGLKVQAGSANNSNVTTGIQFYGAQAQVDASQTLGTYYGIYLETPLINGTLTNPAWSFYAKDTVQTEGRLIVGAAGAQAISQRILFVGDSGNTGNPTLDVRMATSQTAASIIVSDSGGVQRGQWFGSTGNMHIGNAATGGSGNGILSVVTTTAPSGTPAANGGWVYVDPADGDAKVITRAPGGGAGVTRRVAPSHEQLLMEGLGFKAWAFDPNLGSGGTAPTQGTVYARAIPLRAGQVLANVILSTTTAAIGTPPTSMFVGIADSTGKMLAQSNDLRASAIWTAASGMVQAPLSASYTVLADGMYYAIFLQVGAFSGTQPSFQKGVNNSAPAGLGTTIFGTGGTTGQTALPGNNSSIAGGIVTTNGIDYFAGAN